MNGFGNRGGPNGFQSSRPPMLRPDNPGLSGKVLVDGYRKDMLNGFNQENPRFNPMNPQRTQSSVMVDLKDPVQVHLLAETALFDSREYEILSQEEVDDLKKQCQLLSQRIEATRSALTIQSKYRDAAISMSKLYSPSRPEGMRKSLLGNRGSGGDAAREAEEELRIVQKKCEDLAQELWGLEKRIMEPQRRLLQHTAGILQMTHKVNKKALAPAKAPSNDGIPASPESMYTYSNSRNSLEAPDDLLFNDGYQNFEQLDGFSSIGRPRKNTIEIPLKSPVREQNKQLAEESDKLRDENSQLRAQSDNLNTELESLRKQGSQQMRLLSDTEAKLERFNAQLREMVVSSDPRNGAFSPPPSGSAEPGDMLGSHLDYLAKGLSAVGQGSGNSSRATQSVQQINLQMQDVLLAVNPSYPSPPPEQTATLDDQLSYLQNSLRVVDDELQRASEVSSSNSADRQRNEQSDTVLMGLWDIIQSGYAGIQKRKEERRKTRIEKGLEEEEDEMSDTETFDPNEQYSLSAFSNKVQWLYGQATKLKEQKSVLKRQIKQQRELNNKSDGEKDQALKSKVDELEQVRQTLDASEREADGIRVQLSETLDQLEQSQKALAAAEAEATQSLQTMNNTAKEATSSAQKEIKDREAKIKSLEAELQKNAKNLESELQKNAKNLETELQKSAKNFEKTNADLQKKIDAAEKKATVSDSKVADITAQLKEMQNAKSEAEKAMKEAQKAFKDKETELDELNGEYVALKLEATMAKAELDGAYGSRNERAADAAALLNTAASQKYETQITKLKKDVERKTEEFQSLELQLEVKTVEVEESSKRMETLKVELSETIESLADLTKQALGAERKIADLEDELDREKLKVPNSPNPGRKGTEILTEGYRKELRELRARHREELKNEMMIRRKLEEELRALKRAAGPGKSPLSPR